MNKLFGTLRKKVQVYKTRGEEFLYWKRYEADVKRNSVDVFKPLVGWKFKGKKPWKFAYTSYDPITQSGKGLNTLNIQMPLVEPVKEWNFYKGDIVEVLVGPDKGKKGEVYKVVKERNWVFVHGMNRKIDPNMELLTLIEAPLLVTSEVKLVDPSDLNAVDIEWRYDEDGEKVRVSQRTGRIIPIPLKSLHTWEDGVNAKAYKDTKKDTEMDELKKVTFQPVNSTFEEDILKSLGLYEPPKKRKTYWY